MSEDVDKLADDLRQTSVSGEKPKRADFNAAAASASFFTPGKPFVPGAAVFTPQKADSAVTLADFEKSSSIDLNVRVAPKKKVFSLSAKKEPTKPSAAEAEVSKDLKGKAVKTVEKSVSGADTASAAKPMAPAASTAKGGRLEKKTSEKEAEASTSVDADALLREQEALDKQVVQDMFGDDGVKEHMSIIFMGHVDAGKSTMGGNILYLTGAVDKRTVEKYEREALDAGRQGWYLSWVMDTNKEERNEGKTIEVGRATFETEKRRYTILDAPGHKMYVPSMIGGASQADAGILVISSRRGEYETGFEKGGQTREHAILAKTQGVDRLVVVVNKMDDPTVKWSEERYNECTKKLGQFLKATGYSGVVFMPVSGYTGAGLLDRVPKDVCPWYDGPSLLEYLDTVPLVNRKLSAPFMLPISGKAKDLGTVVEGKIESGSVRKGQSLLIMPIRAPVEVSAVYNESENEINGAICGEQVKIKLRGIEEESIQVGNVLTSAENPIRAVTRFEAQIAIVDIPSILTAGFSCVMHVHTAVTEVTFVHLLHKLEKGTNRKSRKPPAYAKKGMKIIAELQTDSVISVEEFDKLPQLGRFTLRDQGRTIAIGKITKILE